MTFPEKETATEPRPPYTLSDYYRYFPIPKGADFYLYSNPCWTRHQLSREFNLQWATDHIEFSCGLSVMLLQCQDDIPQLTVRDCPGCFK